MIALTDFEGLLFYPRSEIAMLRQEREGRLEALTRDGVLAHRPGPLAQFAGPPFAPAGPDALVNPAVPPPPGWTVPAPTGPAPEEPAAEDPLLPGGVRASEVLYLDPGGDTGSHWVTDRGRLSAESRLSGRRLAALHPHMVSAGKYLYVNRRRLRAFRRVLGSVDFTLHFDQGAQLPLGYKGAQVLAARLGLAAPDWIGGETEGQKHLRRLGMQRWPVRLATAPAAQLQAWFPAEPARLLANVAMQTLEARERGEVVLEGDGHRAWFYRPAKRVLRRAGHLAPVAWRDMRPGTYPTFGGEVGMDADRAWAMLCRLLTHLVFVARLFDYRSLGFRDEKPEYRLLGAVHPDLVVLVEKESLLEPARALHEHFGVTVYVTGGLPPVIGAEYLVQDLRARGVGKVRLASWCDFDPPGWDMPTMLTPQLDRYGMPTREIRRLVTPDRFTEEELRLYSVPLDYSDNPIHQSRLKRWMQETGGIFGQPRAISANYLQPVERALEVFRTVAGDWLGPSQSS